MIGRYLRQELFVLIGLFGQKKLKEVCVVIIGVGVFGIVSVEMLVRVGVGFVKIVDRDYVEWSNFQCQQFYIEDDVKKEMLKVVVVECCFCLINSDVDVIGFVMDVIVENIFELIRDVLIIVDVVDNFEICLIVNDVVVKEGIFFFYGVCVGSYGFIFIVVLGFIFCLYCLFDVFLIGGVICDIVGIISLVVLQVVVFQVIDVLKLLMGEECELVLCFFDLWKNEWLEVRVVSFKYDVCLSCGIKDFLFLFYEN